MVELVTRTTGTGGTGARWFAHSDHNLLAIDLATVHVLNRLLSHRRLLKLDKAAVAERETEPRSARHIDILNFAICSKDFENVFLRYVSRQLRH